MKKTISFIEAINPKDRALQTAIRAFSIIRFGGSLTPEEAKLFIEVCSLALPNKYRFPRSELARLYVSSRELIRQRLPVGGTPPRTGRELGRAKVR
jgi:hypothetical protein